MKKVKKKWKKVKKLGGKIIKSHKQASVKNTESCKKSYLSLNENKSQFSEKKKKKKTVIFGDKKSKTNEK